jgi:hypothetical protein
MPAQLSTPRAVPISLLPVDAILPDDHEHLLPSVDDNADLLAREADGGRLGYPRGVFDQPPGLGRPTVSKREHCENLYHEFQCCGWGRKGPLMGSMGSGRRN